MEVRPLISVGTAEGKGFELAHVTTMIPVSDYAAGYRNVEKFLGFANNVLSLANRGLVRLANLT